MEFEARRNLVSYPAQRLFSVASSDGLVAPERAKKFALATHVRRMVAAAVKPVIVLLGRRSHLGGLIASIDTIALLHAPHVLPLWQAYLYLSILVRVIEQVYLATETPTRLVMLVMLQCFPLTAACSDKTCSSDLQTKISLIFACARVLSGA